MSPEPVRRQLRCTKELQVPLCNKAAAATPRRLQWCRGVPIPALGGLRKARPDLPNHQQRLPSLLAHPWVRQHLIHRGTLRRIDAQHARHQVNHGLTSLARKRQGLGQHALHGLPQAQVLVVPGKLAEEHRVQEHPQRPDVGALAAITHHAAAPQHLRSGVANRAHRVHQQTVVRDPSGRAKVPNLGDVAHHAMRQRLRIDAAGRPIRGRAAPRPGDHALQKDVLRLDVAVADVGGVQVLHAARHHAEHRPGHRLPHRRVVLDETDDVPAVAVLHRDHQRRRRLQHLERPHDVLVPQRNRQTHLVLQPPEQRAVAVELRLADHLERVRAAMQLVEAHVDLARGALVDAVEDQEVAQREEGHPLVERHHPRLRPPVTGRQHPRKRRPLVDAVHGRQPAKAGEAGRGTAAKLRTRTDSKLPRRPNFAGLQRDCGLARALRLAALVFLVGFRLPAVRRRRRPRHHSLVRVHVVVQQLRHQVHVLEQHLALRHPPLQQRVKLLVRPRPARSRARKRLDAAAHKRVRLHQQPKHLRNRTNTPEPRSPPKTPIHRRTCRSPTRTVSTTTRGWQCGAPRSTPAASQSHSSPLSNALCSTQTPKFTGRAPTVPYADQGARATSATCDANFPNSAFRVQKKAQARHMVSCKRNAIRMRSKLFTCASAAYTAPPQTRHAASL
ncbi:uncharacterized protein BcabD6B2_12350 [Babesia caballi]|uniref:Uncharacterized protein n=1 Tax=Babesia caballi TaxID=5871 RepID=A0AAV4LQP2_BABCB|nr:hypothetical protein BcabD6B2_12350 [Babesia caballi]